MSLNHLWNINENSALSTSAYASFGSGGGRRDEGSKIGSDDYRIGTSGLQPIDFEPLGRSTNTYMLLAIIELYSSWIAYL